MSSSTSDSSGSRTQLALDALLGPESKLAKSAKLAQNAKPSAKVKSGVIPSTVITPTVSPAQVAHPDLEPYKVSYRITDPMLLGFSSHNRDLDEKLVNNLTAKMKTCDLSASVPASVCVKPYPQGLSPEDTLVDYKGDPNPDAPFVVIDGQHRIHARLQVLEERGEPLDAYVSFLETGQNPVESLRILNETGSVWTTMDFIAYEAGMVGGDPERRKNAQRLLALYTPELREELGYFEGAPTWVTYMTALDISGYETSHAKTGFGPPRRSEEEILTIFSEIEEILEEGRDILQSFFCNRGGVYAYVHVRGHDNFSFEALKYALRLELQNPPANPGRLALLSRRTSDRSKKYAGLWAAYNHYACRKNAKYLLNGPLEYPRRGNGTENKQRSDFIANVEAACNTAHVPFRRVS